MSERATPVPSKPSPPGEGFLGWLGRQVGHIAKAVKTDVTGPAERVVYRDHRIEQQPHPEAAGVLLRRTVVDEVIVGDTTKGSSPGVSGRTDEVR